MVVPSGDTTTDIDESTLPAGTDIQTAGTDPTTTTVGSGSNVTEPADGFFTAEANLSLEKVSGGVVDANGNGITDAGDTITYSFTVTNNGNVLVENAVISDALLGLVNEPVVPSTLAPGAVGSIADQVYTLTAADIANGSVTNTAVSEADAIDPNGDPLGPVSDDSDDPNNVNDVDPDADGDPDDPTVTPLDQNGILNGLVFEDLNGDGVQNAGEPGLGGVDVVVTDSNGVVQVVTTQPDGSWSVVVPSGDTTIDVTDPTGTVLTTVGSDPETVTVVAGTTNNSTDDGYQGQGTVTGFVFEDINNDGLYDPTVDNLFSAGTLVNLTDVNGVVTIVTVDATGNWTATVPSGDYNVDVVDPSGYILSTIGSDPESITVTTNTTVTTTDDGFILETGSIQGHVYNDLNNNGVQDPGEPDLAGVNVIVTDSLGNTQIVVTDSNGDYTVTVTGGQDVTIDIDEATLPAGAILSEGTDPTTVTVISGTTVFEENNGYYIPGVVTGHLYEDLNGNGVQDAGEPDLVGVDVVITDSNGNIQIVTTDVNGDYSALILTPGNVVVDIDDNSLSLGFVQTEGTDPTTVVVTSGSTVFEENNGFNIPSVITGHLYDDVNGNGVQDPGEPDLAGVTVIITDSLGMVQTVVTDVNGDYTVNVSAPGATIIDIDETTLPVGAVQTEGTDPTTVIAVSGVTVFEENNGFNVPGTVSGTIYDDVNGNGVQDPGEPGLSGVTVVITDSLGNIVTVVTDANGNYTAVVSAPGNATVDIDEATLPVGAIQTQGTDPTVVTVVSGIDTFEENNGYNTPATVTGHLYEDLNGNGVQDPGEPDLAGVTVVITDSDGNIQTVITDNNGDYTATIVVPGDVVIDIDETTLPAGATLTEGTDPTTVTVTAGATVFEENNGFNIPGTISGHVYLDSNGNGIQDPGEPDLAGVSVIITDSEGNTQTVITDANGDYVATVIAAGDAIVDIDETTLPNSASQTEGTDPTTVTVISGVDVFEENNGYNYPDNDGDGIPDVDDIDDDNDGIIDILEGNGDSDGDGIPDWFDLDSDGDGIPDNVEGQSTAGYVEPSGVDSDGNGLDDAYENTPGSGEGIMPIDFDGDGLPDYLDEDSDDDGVPDSTEGFDYDNDGQPDVTPSGNDADNDGLDDAFDSTPNGGYDDANGAFVDSDPRNDLNNTDGDEEPDYRDLDDDNDDIITGPDLINGDFDNDGIPDYLDSDPRKIKIFNGVTPDGDGRNDFFIIQGIENFENTVSIFNRWGVEVYNTENYNNGNRAFRGISEGRVTVAQGEKLPEGTYFYVIEYINDQNETVQLAGYLYINR